jgi:hypothetical protein
MRCRWWILDGLRDVGIVLAGRVCQRNSSRVHIKSGRVDQFVDRQC